MLLKTSKLLKFETFKNIYQMKQHQRSGPKGLEYGDKTFFLYPSSIKENPDELV